MNNIFYWLWLADTFSAISGLSTLVIIGYGIGFLSYILAIVVPCDDFESLLKQASCIFNALSKHKGTCTALLCPLLLAIVFVIAIPSKTTMYVSMGASITADITESPTAQKALTLLNNKLDDLLNQGKDEKK